MTSAVRLFIFLAIVSLAALFFGLGESFRCCRALLGPSTIPYSQAATQGLAGYGYVRIQGVQPAMDRCVIIQRQKRGRLTGEVKNLGWKGAYVPLLDAADTTGGGSCTLLAWLPHARKDADISAFGTPTGPNNDEVVGFVESSYDKLDFAEQKNIAPIAQVNTRAPGGAWVIDVRRPSWLKGLGLTLVGLAIPGIAVLYKLKKGFV